MISLVFVAAMLGQGSECAAVKATDNRIVCGMVQEMRADIKSLTDTVNHLNIRVSVLEAEASGRARDVTSTASLTAAMAVALNILIRVFGGRLFGKAADK